MNYHFLLRLIRRGLRRRRHTMGASVRCPISYAVAISFGTAVTAYAGFIGSTEEAVAYRCSHDDTLSLLDNAEAAAAIDDTIYTAESPLGSS